jgi:arginase
MAVSGDRHPIRLLFPQWQGAGFDHVSGLVPELRTFELKLGYYLGSQLLQFLAPRCEYRTVEVPVSRDFDDTRTENGIYARAVLLTQHRAAVELVRAADPSHIVTFGGECSVSVVPFSHLISKYQSDICVLWIDAHPDITVPGDAYPGYHAMALAHILGIGDPEFLAALPAKLPVSHALCVGLRSWDPEPKERQKALGLKGLSPDEIRKNIGIVGDWVRSLGVSKVAIHFDLDVLDPLELIAAVGRDPDGLSIQEVVTIINNIAREFDVVALTIAEHMPIVEIKIQGILSQLPNLAQKQ